GHVDECGDNDVYASSILRWNGTSYESDGNSYIAPTHVRVGDESDVSFETKAGKQYVVHAFKRAGVQDMTFTIDGRSVQPGLVQLTPGCHEWIVRAAGSFGAAGWAMIEERK